jgi:ribonuclease HII
MKTIIDENTIGADEVGYGSWAGPLCIAAVWAPRTWVLDGLNDSKKLSKKARETLSKHLWMQHDARQITAVVKMVTNKKLDAVGVAEALKALYVEVINECHTYRFRQDSTPLTIIDGTVKLDKKLLTTPYQSVVKADAKYPAVMAASIIAKVHRDNFMLSKDVCYPEFDFKNNVGYGTKKHKEALEKLGPTPLHRMSYEPMKSKWGNQ